MQIKVDVLSKDGRAWGPVIGDEQVVSKWMREQIELRSWGEIGTFEITVTKLFKGSTLKEKFNLLFAKDKVAVFGPTVNKLLNESAK